MQIYWVINDHDSSRIEIFTFIKPGWGSTHASFAKPEIRDPDPLAPKLIAVPETVSNKPSWLQEWVSLIGLLRGDSEIYQLDPLWYVCS